MASRHNQRVITECGCVVLPDCVAVLMDSMGRVMAECGTHGTQAVTRRATFRETAEVVYGITIDGCVPENPMFLGGQDT